MPAKVVAHFFVKKQKRMKELGWCRIIKEWKTLDVCPSDPLGLGSKEISLCR